MAQWIKVLLESSKKWLDTTSCEFTGRFLFVSFVLVEPYPLYNRKKWFPFLLISYIPNQYCLQNWSERKKSLKFNYMYELFQIIWYLTSVYFSVLTKQNSSCIMYETAFYCSMQRNHDKYLFIETWSSWILILLDYIIWHSHM